MKISWLPLHGIAATLASVFLCAVPFAQNLKPTKPISSLTIQVAGETLRLGMTRAQVAEKLLGTQVEKLDDDNWRISRTDEFMHFAGGLLSFVERHWTNETTENTNRDIAGDLFYAVQSLNQNDRLSHCTITTGMDDSQSLTKKWVSINCGQKEIVVFKRTFSGHTYDSVEERLGELQ